MVEQAGLQVTVGVCTFRRPEALQQTLDSLARQSWPHSAFEIVVVDNDVQCSAQAQVERFAQTVGALCVRYAVEPGRGVSHVRNHCVALAQGEWLAFIDDDEVACPDWLASLMAAQQRFSADVVLGPVNTVWPAHAPTWLRAFSRGAAYAGMGTGTVVPPGLGGCGNVLMRVADVRARGPEPFKSALSLTGGEDAELFNWLRQQGARIVWCSEAVADEPQPASRLRLGYHLHRSVQFSTVHWRGEFKKVGRLRAIPQAVAGVVLALVCLPLGGLLFQARRALGARLLAIGMLGVGRVLAFLGVQVSGYGTGNDPT